MGIHSNTIPPKEIDIILPVYNCEKFIGEAIQSVLDQTFTDFNLIIINDGSTDSSEEIINKYKEIDPRIISITQKNRGQIASLNTGLELSKSKYIAFIDADDLWKKTKLEKQYNLLSKTADVAVCFTLLREFDSLGNQDIKYAARKNDMKGLSRICFLGAKSLFETYGKFDNEEKLAEFILWFGKLINDNVKYEVLNEVLAFRRIHANNMTQKINRLDYLKTIKRHIDAKRN
ncbi:MAG: glycosyltransferase involved in cell wall biosynthesis [Patiriisocius sp.]|jgi:glycosyltransferase involved in cell wall biosynthesis